MTSKYWYVASINLMMMACVYLIKEEFILCYLLIVVSVFADVLGSREEKRKVND